MKKETLDPMSNKIIISKQAELVIEKTNVDREEFLDWFLNIRGITMGGGDVIDFLQFKKAQEKKTI